MEHLVGVFSKEAGADDDDFDVVDADVDAFAAVGDVDRHLRRLTMRRRR